MLAFGKLKNDSTLIYSFLLSYKWESDQHQDFKQTGYEKKHTGVPQTLAVK